MKYGIAIYTASGEVRWVRALDEDEMHLLGLADALEARDPEDDDDDLDDCA